MRAHPYGKPDLMTGQTTPNDTPAPIPDTTAVNAAQRRPGINWFRFWIQMLVAMMVFNVVAGLVTWYFIFPHLHSAR
jgi:hypothetical protein